MNACASVLDAALFYASLGWAVLPLYGLVNGVCDCLPYFKNNGKCTPAKHPRTAHGTRDATTDELKIRRWFEAIWPSRCNVGIATGPVSGLVVLDVDPRHRGDHTLACLEAELGPLPERTPRARTGSGGEHIYLAHPSGGVAIHNSEGKIGAGLDVRGHGGYVLAPNSVTDKGDYIWLPGCGPDVLPAPIPPTWLELLCPASRSSSSAVGQIGPHGDASLPLGMAAKEFIEHGVPYGQQRARALAATRNLLAIGTSEEDTIELIRRGLERSPQEPGRRPWTRTDAEQIVTDLARRVAPPVRDKGIADGAYDFDIPRTRAVAEPEPPQTVVL